MKIQNQKGFVLGLILLLCIVMAAFIFSYNTIVRNRNLQAHHYMTSELVGNLAVSGVKLLSSRMEKSFSEAIQRDCPQLFKEPADKISQPIEVATFKQFCSETRNDFQKFLNRLVEFKEPGIIGGGLPVCESMEVTIDQLKRLSPGPDRATFQKGRDPVEKGGRINISCVIKHAGLIRKASISQQFRIINMVPGPVARFSLFVARTPYPDSYNAMGVDFDGNVDMTYSHPPAGDTTFTSPLIVLNGTDTEPVSNTVSFKDIETDKKNLLERGWIYIGPSGSEEDAPVFLKIPNGFSPAAGGWFMFGRPTSGPVQTLSAARVEAGEDYRKSDEVPEHNFYLATKYQGFYTSEEGRPMGVGSHNLWPGLATGEEFQPSDRFLAASTWLYPFGTMNQSSRTLVIGPILAGYLKYYYIQGKGREDVNYRGLFTSMTEEKFNEKADAGKELLDFCHFWSGQATPPILGRDFFKNGYSSFKKVMPWNSLPSKNSIASVRGVAFNMIFDFMKYDRNRYPDIDVGPSISRNEFNSLQTHVPLAYSMQNNPVKGIHPSGNMGIYFKDNGEFHPEIYPDNCYFYGDLSLYSVANSSLNENSNRITNVIDLSSCKSLEEENSRIEMTLFKEVKKSGKTVNEPRRTGIFKIIRREEAGTVFSEALQISSKEIFLSKPMILIFKNGSLNLNHDITANLSNGSPDTLLTLALINGDVYISGNGSQRNIHAYITAVGQNGGRLLKPSDNTAAPEKFEIFGGLALSEIGLYQDKSADPRSDVGSTMLHFPGGGKIIYNSRFNPSLSNYSESYSLVIEAIPGTLSVTGGKN
ncbi:MAG: hypothetical protein ACOYXC_18950 [Candidatus Rifleibacteriota bacterium]